VALEFICSANDRDVIQPGSPGSWTSAHDGAGNRFLDWSNYISTQYKVTTFGDYQLVRAWLDFDLTDLPSGWTSIYNVVKLKLYIEDWYDYTHGSTGDLVVVQGVQHLPVQVSDYGAQVSYVTPGGTFDADDFSGAGWYYITLNDTGKGWITAGQTFKLCLRSRGDVNDSPVLGDFMHRPFIWSRDADINKAARLVFETVYPIDGDSLTRVTGIRHIYRPGLFRMQVSLGDVSNTVEIAEHKVRKELEIPEQQTPEPKVPPEWPEPAPPAPKPVPKPEPPSYWGVGPVSEIPGIGEYREKALRREQEPEYEQIPGLPPSMRREVEKPSLWSRITPWKEESGETFGSEIAERFEVLRKLFGGLFGGK